MSRGVSHGTSNPPSPEEEAVNAYGKCSLSELKVMFFSLRGLRLLIKKILPDLKIFYGFGLKQVP